MKIIEIYEYGNGTYAEPFWDRVQKKIDKVEEEYEIINMDKKFIPSHYIGENCMGMDVYRDDELFLTLYCKRKQNQSLKGWQNVFGRENKKCKRDGLDNRWNT